ncbi:hypothetical protein [Minwuia sp.]|uniref:hypothetical protein n=1 Tax=Minwuia sp. TaxID=2493630 RepID=UPI003A93E1A0
MDADDKALRQAERAREADERLDDHNAELSGTKSGYIYRTSAADHESRPDIRAKKARKAEARISALEALLASDPNYAALYNETRGQVIDAANEAEARIEAITEELASAEAELSELESNAARTGDGRMAFRTSDGRVVDENGQEIAAPEAASIVWPNDAPSYDDYLDRKKAVQDAQDALAAWREYQAAVGEAKDRLDDPDNPLSEDELEEIQELLERSRPEPTAAPEESASSEVAPAAAVSSELPKL